MFTVGTSNTDHLVDTTSNSVEFGRYTLAVGDRTSLRAFASSSGVGLPAGLFRCADISASAVKRTLLLNQRMAAAGEGRIR